jgi:DNA-binding MarR family transcriptional regulator
MHYSPAMPALDRITGCTCARLRKLTRRITQHYDVRLAPAGLRVTQFSLLATLCHGGPAKLSALAGAMEMDRTTLSRNLKPLTDAGFVAVAAGDDARERLVTATERGRRAWLAARGEWRRAQDEVNRTLGVEQVVALHELLDESLARLRTARAGESDAQTPRPKHGRRE